METTRAHKLLARAVASSHKDDTFVQQFTQLATTQPKTLTQHILTYAALDPLQAKLAHNLLAIHPNLLRQQTNDDDQTLLLHAWARKHMRLAPQLPTPTRQAVLILIEALTRPRAGSGSASSVGPLLAPLVDPASFLLDVLLPLASPRSSAATATAALDAALRILNAHASAADPALVPPLPSPLLAALLSAVLGLLVPSSDSCTPRRNLFDVCRRCAAAAVQMLLPRVAHSASSSWLVGAMVQWKSLPWEVRLHAWPLWDRLGAARGAVQGVAACGEATDTANVTGRRARPAAGARLLRWLHETSAGEPVHSLICAAGNSSLPVREATKELLRYLPHGKETSRAILSAAALRLAAASQVEWRVATLQLQALLSCAAGGLGFIYPEQLPKPQAAAVQSARALLCMLLALRVAPDNGAFAAGFAGWLADAEGAFESPKPLFFASLLAVALRAAAHSAIQRESPTDPFFVASLRLKRRLLQMAPADEAAAAALRLLDDEVSSTRPGLQLASGMATALLNDAAVRQQVHELRPRHPLEVCP